MKRIGKILLIIAVALISLSCTHSVKAATNENAQEKTQENINVSEAQCEVVDVHEIVTEEIEGIARTGYSTTVRFRFGLDSSHMDILLTINYYYSDGLYVEIYDDYSISHENRYNVVWAYEATHKIDEYSDSQRFVLLYDFVFANDPDNKYLAMMYIDVDYWGNVSHDSTIGIIAEA